jgi:hypothetical protein
MSMLPSFPNIWAFSSHPLAVVWQMTEQTIGCLTHCLHYRIDKSIPGTVSADWNSNGYIALYGRLRSKPIRSHSHFLQLPASNELYPTTCLTDRKEWNVYIQLTVRLEMVALQTTVAAVSCPVQTTCYSGRWRAKSRPVHHDRWARRRKIGIFDA